MTPRRARGQALVAGVGLLAAGCAALWLLHGAGRDTAAKRRLVDATDAAAYSAAVWRARVLNFDAYANRAIVAQEVAIAQAITLASWSAYFEQLTASAATVSRLYPPAAAALEAAHEAASMSARAARASADIEVAARGAAGIGYAALLQASQERMHRSADAFALGAIATEIAQASDRRFFAHLLSGDDFSRFTRRWTSAADRGRLADVVRASLDGFTGGARRADLQLIPFLPSGCFASFDRERMFDWLRKRGATTLSGDLERWEAHDTSSLHAWRSSRGLFGLARRCTESEALPLGWGGAEATAAPLGAIETDAHDSARNPSARSSAAGGLLAFERYGGIPRVRELADGVLAGARPAASRIAVLGRVDASALRTATPADGVQGEAVGHGRLRLRTRHADGRLWALSVAQVDFARPESAGGAELASLYSPYWQARLVAPTDAERTEALRRAD